MSVNSFKPHVLVLPEDDANRQIVNGFLENLNINLRAIQVLHLAKGWSSGVDQLLNDEIKEIRKYSERRIILLIDFDNNQERLSLIMNQVPEEVKDRVFIIGVESNPEDLKRSTKKSFEKIGEALADDCVDDKDDLWGHELLKHNARELVRMRKSVKPFLFLAN